MSSDSEIMTGLSHVELEALADSQMALSLQAHLDDLLARNAENQLSASELAELDRLLQQVDLLTVLKTRARYTLQHQLAGAVRA